MTFLAPTADVTFHAVPNKTRGDSSLSRLVSRMAEASADLAAVNADSHSGVQAMV